MSCDVSIVTVNFNAYDFLRILLQSADRFTTCNYAVVCVDNSNIILPVTSKGLVKLDQNHNIGHGEGLNVGIQYAHTNSGSKYTMIIDVDCHFLCGGWDNLLISGIQDYEILAGRGVPQKPIRAACIFLETALAVKYDWRATPGYHGVRQTPSGTDTAIAAYYQMVKEKRKIAFLEPIKPNRYGTLNGEEFTWLGKPVAYHHWHGTHLKERSVDFTGVDLLADRDLLFSKIAWSNL